MGARPPEPPKPPKSKSDIAIDSLTQIILYMAVELGIKPKDIVKYVESVLSNIDGANK